MISSSIIIILAVCVSHIQANSSDLVDDLDDIQRKLDVKELELLNKLLSPNDTTLQQDTKTLLAHYLVSQALAEAEQKRIQAAGGGINSSTNTPDVVATLGKETTKAPTTPLPSRTESTATVSSSTTTTERPRSTPSPEHVFNQVDKILQNVASGNVVGIVDESLAIRAPDPVRNLVNGILTTIFCNPIDRLFNRCRPSASSPNRNRITG